MTTQPKDLDTPTRGDGITHNDIGGPEELMAAIDATLKPISDGDLVTGTVVKIDPEEVLVDIGYKSEGVVPDRELSIRNDVKTDELVSIGDTLECVVLQKEDKDGRLILSKKRATYEKAWQRIEEHKRNDEPVEGKVIEVVKGGLILDVGIRGFLPASLVELRRVKDLDQYVGREITCKIIELDKNRNNVVLSRRAFLEEASSEERKDFLDNLAVEERRTGTVSSIVNFGAFVDLGGVDGLVHVSELSWRHIEHPSEVVEVGQEIEVEVLDVDLERERVSLSLKNTQEDPWAAFARTHEVGDLIDGKITKTVPFGAFIDIGEGIEGLVHISELSESHVELAEQVVEIGQEVQARVIDLDMERRRISLSIRQAHEGVPVEYSTSSAPPAPPEPKEEADFEPEPAAAQAPAEEAPADQAPAEEAPAEEAPAEETAEAAAEEVVAEPAAPTPEPATKAPETGAVPDDATSEAEPVAEAEAPSSADEDKEGSEEKDKEMAGELLDSDDSHEESLEDIVKEMKKDLEEED